MSSLVMAEHGAALYTKLSLRRSSTCRILISLNPYVPNAICIRCAYLLQLFINGLRRSQPPVMTPDALDEFIEEVFGNISSVRECNRRLLEVMAVRQREQAPIIQRIGDVFLTAAADFRHAYPIYVGHLPVAEKRIKEEQESNVEFRRFLEVILCYSPAAADFHAAMCSSPRIASFGIETFYSAAI